ncbi:hypothetical protein K9M79_03225 [Candidatus Woesearchaeota archaeon]|nr:hypothetical protein [Candidatus Woesearchaeota archaeon]
MKRELLIIFVLAIVVLSGCVYEDGPFSNTDDGKTGLVVGEGVESSESGSVDNPASSGSSASVELYVMSQCPFGVKALDAVIPAKKELGDAMDLQIDYILYPKQSYAGREASFCIDDLCSMHGIAEVKGNIAHLCVQKYEPSKHLDFISCVDKEYSKLPDNWEGCADQLALNKNDISTCINGDEGKTLLRESAARADAAGASGSPTIKLDGESFGRGGATTATDFLRGVCQATGNGAAACADIPQPVDVNAVVVTDSNCKTCNHNAVISQLRGLFPGIKTKVYDYATAEGKSMYETAGLKLLPAFIFDESVKKADAYDQISRYLQPTQDGRYELRTGSTWDPNAEICDNSLDDDGDGAVDCADSECKGTLACMEKKTVPTVEAFVMSHCPFGTQIEKGLIPVQELLGDKIDFKIKFVNYAMHGDKEIYEQLNQYCIQEEQTDKYMTYLKCFLKDGQSDACLIEADIDAEALKECTDEVDTEYQITANFNDKTTWMGNYPPFKVNEKEVQQYGVRGSPGLVVNGVLVSSARDPQSLLETICQGFTTKPAECSQSLDTTNPSSGFGFEAGSAAASAGSCG